jgi:RNA polymerase sigma factor (sigma-70 family)
MGSALHIPVRSQLPNMADLGSSERSTDPIPATKVQTVLPVMVNLEALPSKCELPYQSFARIEARFRVRTAIQKLPRRYRDVLVLCDLKQLTIRESAKRMNASIPLVKTRLSRARRMLAVALNDQAG